MSCACKGRDGPQLESLVVFDEIINSNNPMYSEPQWWRVLGDGGRLTGEIRVSDIIIGASPMLWVLTQFSQDGVNWVDGSYLVAGSLSGGNLAAPFDLDESEKYPGWLMRFAVYCSVGSVVRVRIYANPSSEEVEATLTDPEPPESMARRLVAASLMEQPKVLAGLRDIVLQVLAEDRARLAERPRVETIEVFDEILAQPNGYLSTTRTDFDAFLGDYEIVQLQAECETFAGNPTVTLTVDLYGSSNGVNWAPVKTGLISGTVSVPTGRTILRGETPELPLGKGRLLVTITGGDSTYRGRVRIWATITRREATFTEAYRARGNQPRSAGTPYALSRARKALSVGTPPPDFRASVPTISTIDARGGGSIDPGKSMPLDYDGVDCSHLCDHCIGLDSSTYEFCVCNRDCHLEAGLCAIEHMSTIQPREYFFQMWCLGGGCCLMEGAPPKSGCECITSNTSSCDCDIDPEGCYDKLQLKKKKCVWEHENAEPKPYDPDKDKGAKPVDQSFHDADCPGDPDCEKEAYDDYLDELAGCNEPKCSAAAWQHYQQALESCRAQCKLGPCQDDCADTYKDCRDDCNKLPKGKNRAICRFGCQMAYGFCMLKCAWGS